MTSTLRSLIRLAPGEVLHLPLDARTTLQVAAGSAAVREPWRWLADTVVAPEVNLAEGQCHRLARAGWVTVQAGRRGAEVVSHPDASRWQRLSQWIIQGRIGLKRPRLLGNVLPKL